MIIEDYVKKAEYLRSIGQTALANDIEDLLQLISHLDGKIIHLNNVICDLTSKKEEQS